MKSFQSAPDGVLKGGDITEIYHLRCVRPAQDKLPAILLGP